MTKILVIEDEHLLREMITELLEEEGFTCVSAENGKLGIESAKAFKPDLIISDIKMPEMNGHQVLDELKKDPATATIPFIFLSAMVDKKDQRLGMNLGADDYITKPFEPEDLITAVKTRLAKNLHLRKKLDELRESIALSLPHELQTPLISIIGYSDILLNKFKENQSSQEYEFSKAINDAGKRLNHLIQNFVLFSKLESAVRTHGDALKFHSDQTLIPVSKISKIIYEIAEKYNRREDLQAEIIDAKIRINFNHFLLILEELIDNAFKFSVQGEKVIVKNYCSQNEHVLEIKDNGRGMTEEQIQKIGAYIQFERKQYEQQGSGLGLAISKKIAELYGARFEISSIYGKETDIKIYFLT